MRQIQAKDELSQLVADAHYSVYWLNRKLAEHSPASRIYWQVKGQMNFLCLELAAAKWWNGTELGTHSAFVPQSNDPARVERIKEACKTVTRNSEALIAYLNGEGDFVAEDYEEFIEFKNEMGVYKGTPIVPTICPIVVLKGSGIDMGRQYVKQVSEIYGAWIFEQIAGWEFTAANLEELSKWRDELIAHVPDVYDFAKGWVDGAAEVGLEMSLDQATAVFCGYLPPAKSHRPFGFAFSDEDANKSADAYFGAQTKSFEEIIQDVCSGICAWGAATRSGNLIAGSSTDHDCTFQATIVAYPDSGHSFIYTPFSVNGHIPVLGNMFFAGHPGMNAKGVAYVHHAGGNSGEPKEQWSYGIRRGPATLHMLRFADTAADAVDMMMTWPVGDSGITLGTAGGLVADNTGGFAVESRTGAPVDPKPIVRAHTLDAFGTTFDFLYANNNSIDPRSKHANGAPEQGFDYSLAGGWYTLDPKVIFETNEAMAVRRLLTRNSEARNCFSYGVMMDAYGDVDLERMQQVYQTSGTRPEGDLDDLSERWLDGERWGASVAHRNNAFVAFMEPSAAGGGRYQGCIGPAKQSLEIRDPSHGFYYFDETNTWWEIRLKDTPDEVLSEAITLAAALQEQAQDALENAETDIPELSALMEKARLLLAAAQEDAAESSDLDKTLAALSKRLRAATASQVRARQIISALQ